jgi:hypothetical protein
MAVNNKLAELRLRLRRELLQHLMHRLLDQRRALLRSPVGVDAGARRTAPDELVRVPVDDVEEQRTLFVRGDPDIRFRGPALRCILSRAARRSPPHGRASRGGRCRCEGRAVRTTAAAATRTSADPRSPPTDRSPSARRSAARRRPAAATGAAGVSSSPFRRKSGLASQGPAATERPRPPRCRSPRRSAVGPRRCRSKAPPSRFRRRGRGSSREMRGVRGDQERGDVRPSSASSASQVRTRRPSTPTTRCACSRSTPPCTGRTPRRRRHTPAASASRARPRTPPRRRAR